MEVAVNAHLRGTVDGPGRREALRVLTPWQPPEGFNMMSLEFSEVGNRAPALVETHDASFLTCGAAPFDDWVHFGFVPVIPAHKSPIVIGHAQVCVD